ncbi:MAG: hypothetical protein ACOZAN_01480 [Patescibacteria group bacterium]
MRDIEISLGTGWATNFGTLFSALLTFVMVIAAVLAFGFLIYGSIEWIASGGDKGKTESARNKLTASVIGLVVLASSYAILTLALNFLGFDGGINQVFDSTTNIHGN